MWNKGLEGGGNTAEAPKKGENNDKGKKTKKEVSALHITSPIFA